MEYIKRKNNTCNQMEIVKQWIKTIASNTTVLTVAEKEK